MVMPCCGNCDYYQLRLVIDDDGDVDDLVFECHKIKSKPVILEERVSECKKFKLAKRLEWQLKYIKN